MKFEPIEFEDIFIGMKVMDIDPDFGAGVIVKIDSIHNVTVQYDKSDSQGFYCLDKNCPDYDPVYYTVIDSRKKKLNRVLNEK